jgi:hypothetical protein
MLLQYITANTMLHCDIVIVYLNPGQQAPPSSPRLSNNAIIGSHNKAKMVNP